MTSAVTVPVAGLTPERARALTDRIRSGLAEVWSLITEAYVAGAHHALGYGSWDEYVQAEFETSRLRLPREERAEVVASMRDAGMTVREIASATGLGRGTVGREVVPNGTDDEPALTQEQCEALAGTDDLDEIVDAEIVEGDQKPWRNGVGQPDEQQARNWSQDFSRFKAVIEMYAENLTGPRLIEFAEYLTEIADRVFHTTERS